MTRIRPLLVLLALLAVTAAARAADDVQTIVRTQIREQGDVWVGQQVTLDVEVLSTGIFKGAPRLALPSPDGVVVFASRGAAVNTTTTVDGVSMSGTITSVHVVAQRAGTLSVPSFPIEVSVAPDGTQAGETVRLTADAVAVTAKMPPGAERLSTLVCATSFEAQQAWDTDATEFDAGGALKRTISMSAPDVLGMAFPRLTAPEIDGVAAYVAEPVVEDRSERGETEGRRSDTVTYVFERAGSVRIPDLVITWFDLESQTLKRIELEGRTVTVAPGPESPGAVGDGASDKASAPSSGPPWGTLLGVLGGLAVLALLVHRLRPRVLAVAASRREQRASSEAGYFARFEAACEAGDARAALRTLYAWLGRLSPSAETVSLDDLLRDAGDERMDSAAASLQAAAFGPGRARWDGSDLLACTSAYRTRTIGRGAEIPLAPLNPGRAALGDSRRPKHRVPAPPAD